MLSILITSESKNPYVSEIANGLSEFFQVKRSINDFLGKKGDYDIIHIQWPEEITAWSIPSQKQLDEVQDALCCWKKKAKIVITRHNILPNKDNPEKYELLYDLVYSYGYAVIHLGDQSLKDFYRRYPGRHKQLIHKVIPHHIYESYPNMSDRNSARKYLRLSKKDIVILCFGSIRSKKQFKRVFEAYNKLELPDKCLVIPRYKAIGYSFRHHTLKRIKFILQQWYYKMFFNVILSAGFIENDKVQYYFNSADVVFIPRTEQLNSGVIFLALAFNKPLTGPSKGNMEEVIKYFGYPIFDPKNNDSIVSALKQSLRISTENTMQRSIKNLGLYSLQQSIDKHKELYLQLCGEKYYFDEQKKK